ncbi:MAG: SPFH domain-containing protein [Chloroflexi bacterium]|nr:SPFH domain-containing protein [Chloroflexota bacterium]
MARVFDVVEWPDTGGRDMVYRWPPTGSGDIRIGSQLVVRESQAAVFFRDGKALDTFGPGRHTLTTANIPLLIGLLGKLFSDKSPFTTEVYFVNLREFVDMKWGTPEPIALRDSELGMVRLGAFGTYSLQISDPQLFVNKIVGVRGIYQTGQIESYLRSIIVTRLTDLLGEINKSLFDLPRLYEEIGAGVRAKLADDFAALGIDLKAFFVNSINATEETVKAIDERAAMGAIGDMQKYLQFKAAQAMGTAAAAGGAGDLTSAGVGLGAGVGMGAAMASAISSAIQAGKQEAAAPGALTKAQVQATLDNLDMRLAAGEISEATYKELRAKWEKKLAELG